ncbi:cytochrome c biogenesis CcdA family protein [Nesterenkonia sp. LB17]|uniref:cytochrome c biogenesis CcdA family protein n=1 Tax=unclassified Nesterenkonia TaxID=2629769 RepID=UPI001F4C5FDD|nr:MULTISPECIES: cytochrome c biogenesis CcdA family protein [unclassified Nesterenkonia]MCH8563101.1 cytochrome c biogenesis CcdA family protein [Nesterenkonia sp. YGD6]MCH8565083.1 cytochrome c biogenesis CcdA family protein [Nesterenkonia sp. LB17]MCH8571535.1 cytochrome c biogenesis CcdA family protein [Nesterenkonia sp. AY15]
MEISLVTAFLGGMLALLSPCSALLLPAFFASTVGARLKLLVHGSIFYLGLILTLVPLGLGLGAVGTLFIDHRQALIVGTSVILILLGLAQMVGLGFDFSKALPGTQRLQQQAHTRKGLVRTFLLGAASGVAGFCAGPILGAILTLAVAQGSVPLAGLMLAVYGAGMVVPLIILAALWGRIGTRSMRFIRGRGFTVLGRQLHTTSVIAGALIAGVGVLFWTTNGLVTAPSLVPSETQGWLQAMSSSVSGPVADILLILGISAAILLVWAVNRRSSVRAQERAPDTRKETLR